MPTPLEIAVAALREIYEAGYDVGFPFCGTAKRALQAIEGAAKETGGGDALLREWLVIEDSRKNAVFAPDEAQKPKGYIPRDVAEALLGRDLGGAVWFTKEDSEKMRANPEWRDTLPPTKSQTGGGDVATLRRIVYQNERAPTCPPGHEDIKFLLRLIREDRAALRDSYREGAEAMRESCAKYAENQYHMNSFHIAIGIRALPIRE